MWTTNDSSEVISITRTFTYLNLQRIDWPRNGTTDEYAEHTAISSHHRLHPICEHNVPNEANVCFGCAIHACFYRHRMHVVHRACHIFAKSLQNCMFNYYKVKPRKRTMAEKIRECKTPRFFRFFKNSQNGNENSLFWLDSRTRLARRSLGNATNTKFHLNWICMKWQNTKSRSTFNLLFCFVCSRTTSSRTARAFVFTVQLLHGLLLEFTLTNLLL